MIDIVPVSNRAQQKKFMQLAWDMYRGDPNWVPPLRTDQKELLNFKKHPFYENAEIQTFLAEEDGNIVGRIAAIIDRGHNERYHENRGMFGFFECQENVEVSRALFDAVSDWHLKKGMDCARGPLNPAMNHECGLLIDGFEFPPTFKMTYNKPYYSDLIEDYGFEKSQDLYAYWGDMSMLDTIDPKLKFIVDEAQKRFNIQVRNIDTGNYKEDINTFLQIYNSALQGTWGFVPLSESEIRHMAAGLKHLIVPKLTSIAEVDGKPIGVVFGLLDYNPIIKRIDGRLFPFGFMRLLMGRKNLKKARLVSTNVIPEFQKWGVGVILMASLVENGLDWGLMEAEFSWVLESNTLSRQTLERGGAIAQKTYRLYDKQLA